MQKEKNSGNIIDLKVLQRLYEYIRPYSGRFYFLIFLTIAIGVINPVRPLLVSYAIDDYIAVANYHGLLSITIVLLILLTLSGVFQYLHTFLSGWLGQYIIKDIRIKLYEHLLRMQLKFFDRTPIGRLVTRNVSDIETLSEVFSQGLAALIADVLQLIFILTFMFYLDWKLTLMSLSTFPLLVISTYIFKEKIKQAFNEVRTAVSNLNSFVQEHITGMSIVQIFNSEEREFKKFREINQEHRKANIKSVMYYSIYYPVSEVIQALGIGLIVWFGAKGVIQEYTTFGDLTAFIMYLNMFFRPIRQIADRYNTLQMGIVSSSRIFDLLDNHDQIPNEGRFAPKNLHGTVEFKNVWFAYNNEDYVLKNISFKVEQGKTIALVGATGAGKSSVINLLSRFYDINRGALLVDGVSVKDYELSALRNNIGVVLQDVFLFSNTIEENINLGNYRISRKQIYDAAELVGAKSFIERLPGKLEYNVMERGATLSVGQRQLISFIRAMVYDPKIIVLDEATSSVDSETEELIQTAIQKMMSGRTSIVIAHRLSTIQNADKILVLDHGKIVEEGTHQELLNKNGFYNQLYNMQYKEVV
ncbi:MAG: ABC transporter ATP-binding protein/permease [Cytophagales bacterium]|nr:ABC transporter ATP-binding protein/permease [Cytophagales bacterium]